ncbi:hypothetical protein O3G_MSEX001071 [Manduca sexta]|nr:hypothetical protein O3G_MSEX001071 [Manduca sexta]
MEVERNASDSENVAADEKPVGDEGAGDATTSHSDKLRRKNKKYARSNSKEGVTVVAPLPKYRSWKNSRRPRNGHGRGLPKKGACQSYLCLSINKPVGPGESSRTCQRVSSCILGQIYVILFTTQCVVLWWFCVKRTRCEGHVAFLRSSFGY